MLPKITEEHSDWCLCFDCNAGYLNQDKKGENKITRKKFTHIKSCKCLSCVPDKKESTDTLDHGTNCICYKCKKNKDIGKTGSVVTSNTSTHKYTKCHEGNVFVFEKDDVRIYGAGNMKDAEPQKVDIVIDLDRNVRVATWADDLPKNFKSRECAKSNTVVLDLFIKDMHAPEHVTAEFWKLFWKDLVGEAKKSGGKIKVLVMCQGGHGRTGVVITSLIMASAYNKKNIPEDVHPVGWLRKNYCDSAVESLRQTDYLTRIWGLRFVSASKSTGSSSFSKGSDMNGSGGKEIVKQPVPDNDSECIECKAKRTSHNRILFSPDLKEFECDKCFGIRSTEYEKEEEEEEAKSTEHEFDNTDPCDGTECFDQYNDMTDSWLTVHTYDKGCEMNDEDCGGKFCGFHSNSMSLGLVHTYDEGCNAKEGDNTNKTINEMTEEEWAKSLL